MPPTEIQLNQLRSFRRAAAQIRDASIIAEGQRIQIHGVPHESGHVDIYVQLLHNEAFRSLALAIRLVYQDREPANFRSVANVLFREGDADLRSRVAEIRAGYDGALQDPAYGVHFDDGMQPDALSAEEMFRHWLYGIVFHQDPDRQPTVRRLEDLGAHFIWPLQALSLQLAGRVLDLDDCVAFFLNEDALPRIRPPGEVV